MSVSNIKEVQKALSSLRHEVPSELYFSGVLAEFHRRQRQDAVCVKSWQDRSVEFLKDMWFFKPVRLVQTVAFSFAFLFFAVAGFRQSLGSASETVALWSEGMSKSGSTEASIVAHVSDSLDSSALSHPIELASLSVEGATAERVQYVSSAVASSYDAVVSF